jgi:hypothetical protein
MTKEHILDIALKVFGIYCVIETLKFVFFVGPLFIRQSDKFWEHYSSKIAYLVSQIPYLLLHLILAYIFLFKTQWIIRLVGGKEYDTSLHRDSQTSQWLTYSFCIKILGLYYFVSSAAALAAYALELVVKDSGSFHIYGSGRSFLTNIFILLLSLLFIFKSGKVEDLIAKRKKDDTQQITHADRG